MTAPLPRHPGSPAVRASTFTGIFEDMARDFAALTTAYEVSTNTQLLDAYTGHSADWLAFKAELTQEKLSSLHWDEMKALAEENRKTEAALNQIRNEVARIGKMLGVPTA